MKNDAFQNVCKTKLFFYHILQKIVQGGHALLLWPTTVMLGQILKFQSNVTFSLLDRFQKYRQLWKAMNFLFPFKFSDFCYNKIDFGRYSA